MVRPAFAVAALFTASAAAWSTRLLLDPEPFAAAPAALLAADLALLAAVAVTGMLVAKGRWARGLAVAESLAWLGVGAVMPLDLWGVAAIVAAGASLAAAAGPWLTRGWLRHRPSADGPPVSAVAVMLGLLAVPAVVAVAGWNGLGPLDWALSGMAVVAGWGLGRGSVVALWTLRLGLAPLALAAGIDSGLPGGPAPALAGLALAAASWRRDIGLAVSPIAAPPAARVPIPPELTPRDVLEAAGLDERGRPREPR